MFSNQSGIKLEISDEKYLEKSLITWKQNNILQNNLWVKDKIEKIKKYFVI